MIESSVQYVPAPHLLCQGLDGEMVLLNTESATYFSLNETGTCVWRLLTARTPTDEVCRTLASQHDVPPDQVMADLAAFIEDLLKDGLIVEASRPIP